MAATLTSAERRALAYLLAPSSHPGARPRMADVHALRERGLVQLGPVDAQGCGDVTVTARGRAAHQAA